MLRKESYEVEHDDDNSESSVAETFFSEYPPYELDFIKEPYGGDSGIHIVTICQLAVEQNDISDEKQEPICNPKTYAERKGNQMKPT